MPKIGETFNPYRMFTGIFIPEAVCRYRSISAIEKLIYGRLMRYAGENGDAYPAVPTLADEIGLGDTQCRIHIDALVDDGFIKIERRPGKSDVYSFLWHKCYDGEIGESRVKPVLRKSARPIESYGFPQDQSYGNPQDTPSEIRKTVLRISEDEESHVRKSSSQSFEESQADSSFSSSQKNQNQNQQTATPEESTPEQDSLPIADAPSQSERLDQDVASGIKTDTGIPIDLRGVKKILKTRLVRAGVKFKGKDIKYRNNREDLKRFIDSLGEYTSEGRLLGALESFESATYWHDFDRQVGAFVKLFNNSDSGSTPKTHARPPKSAVAKPNGIDPSPATSNTANAASGLESPTFVTLWNATVPDALRQKYDLPKLIADRFANAKTDPEFVDKFDLICAKCVKIHEAKYLKETPNFPWLFESKFNEPANWWRVANDGFVWAESPKGQRSNKPKGIAEIYKEKLAKALEKEKLNGSNGSKSSQGGSVDRGAVGTAIGIADDGERDSQLGGKSA